MIKEGKDRIRYIGYVPEDDLAKIYNLARVLVYPSFYEGFGLPPLEAMACGCPVIVSNAASLPEVCAEAAYYVDPKDTADMGKSIMNFLENDSLRSVFIQKAMERAQNFRWEKSAYRHLELFEDVYRSGG